MLYKFPKLLTAAGALVVATGPALAAELAMPNDCGKEWTVADQNNDGAVSRDESQSFAAAEFARLDIDGDGKISDQEFAQCSNVALSAKMMAGAEPETVDGRKVVNGMVLPDATLQDDGESKAITRDRVFSDAAKYQRGRKNTVTMENQARTSGSWFAAHDTNNDGKISAEENIDSGPSTETYASRFQSMDANGDGTVDNTEWNNHYRQAAEASGRLSEESAASNNGEAVPGIWYFYVY